MSGHWQSVNLGDEAQTNKFLRLMGGKKSTGATQDTPQNPVPPKLEEKPEASTEPVPTNEDVDEFDEQRKSKFFRLMGGKKANTKPEEFEKKSLGSRTSEDEHRMKSELESQYQQSLLFKLSGNARRHTGLGFAPDTSTEPVSDKPSEAATSDLSSQDQQQEQGDRDREARGDRESDRSHDNREKSHDYRDRDTSHDYRDRSHDHRETSHDYRDRSHDYRDRSRDYRDRSRDYRDRPHDQRDRSYEHRDRDRYSRDQDRGYDRRGSDR